MQYVPDFELHVTQRGVVLPWQCIEALVGELWQQIHKEMYVPERLLALGKGALIPARLLAKEKTPVYYAGVRSYEGEMQADLECYQQPCDGQYITDPDFLNDPGTLIVDDLWDTGKTFRWAETRWPKAKRAALLSKQQIHGLSFVGLVFPVSSWIIFPWENG